MYSFITESDILSMINKNIKKIGDFGKKTVGELELGKKGVFVIHQSKLASEAFHKIDEKVNFIHNT
jgi:hypothetical protein